MDGDIASKNQPRPPIEDGTLRCLSGVSPTWLMQHDAGMRQGIALPFGTGGQQERAHRGRLADTDGADGRTDVLHGIVDCQSGRDRATGRIDVEVDLLLRRLALEEE